MPTTQTRSRMNSSARPKSGLSANQQTVRELSAAMLFSTTASLAVCRLLGGREKFQVVIRRTTKAGAIGAAAGLLGSASINVISPQSDGLDDLVDTTGVLSALAAGATLGVHAAASLVRW